MKNPILWAAALLMASCTPGLKVEVANTTPTERDDETVEIAWSEVAALKGVTPEELAKTRHELLATKPADLAAMADVLRKYAREGKFCTFSGTNGGA